MRDVSGNRPGGDAGWNGSHDAPIDKVFVTSMPWLEVIYSARCLLGAAAAAFRSLVGGPDFAKCGTVRHYDGTRHCQRKRGITNRGH